MIEYTMLIILGICIGGLVAFLFAPSVWHRAVRLTTKRLEATMPMSLSEIEADKDLLRASYAVKIRRLEAGLNKARDKSANQLVEISRHQMEIAELRRHAARLETELEERRNAATVLQTTIEKRVPELESRVSATNQALNERAADVEDLQGQLSRREEALKNVQRVIATQQDELANMRAILEQRGEDRTGRFKRRPSEWGLEEYRSEYDRLNLELSRLREQLGKASDFETRQIALVKREMQQLAEQILMTTPARATESPDSRSGTSAGEASAPPMHRPSRQTPRGQPQLRPLAAKPWRGGASTVTGPTAGEANIAAATAADPPAQTADGDTEDDENRADRASLADILTSAIKKEGLQPESNEEEASTHALAGNSSNIASASGETASGEADSVAEAAASGNDAGTVFREIMEGTAPATAEAEDDSGDREGAALEAEPEEAAENEAGQEQSDTQTLIDRLRLVQERQTG